MKREADFTQGKILEPLVRFMIPILFAMLLQDLYGAVDMLIVGQFATTPDVSGVTTGAQIMSLITNFTVNFSMGITILLGQQIGRGEREKGGKTIGAGIVLFGMMGVALSVIMCAAAPLIAGVMHAPKEAFAQTVQYIRICGGGSIVIVAFNLIGGVFRGIGDSRTPLMTVAIACVFNIFGDLMLVAVLRMGAAGAAIATVGAQAISVCLSLLILRRRELSFTLRRQDIRVDKGIFLSITRFGLPLALQGLLIGFSFLAILMIVNSISVITSAGLGVANRIIAFIMVVPSAFGQAMAAFVAQNAGARKFDRATKALRYGITVSLACGVVMCLIALFLGGFLAGLFTRDPEVVINAHSYLKAYAIDCMLTPFLFCFIGFFNGLGYTKFTMAQGIIGAFCVRVPASYFLSKVVPVTLFKIGLATPMSTSLQIILCFGFLYYVKTRKWTAEDAGI